MDLYSAEQFMVQLSEVGNELPVSPDILGALFQSTSSYSYMSMDDISMLISRDQGLTAKILSKANSAYYGLQGQISSVSRALNILGMAELRRIILFIALKSMGAKIKNQVINLDEYWDHQCTVAVMAGEICSMCGRNDSEDLFTMGILHDMGKLMIAMCQPWTWSAITKIARNSGMSIYDAEQDYWGIDHAIAGSMVLRRWNLPENLTEAINWHHIPEKAAEKYKDQARIIFLADTLSHHLTNSAEPLDNQAFARLDLDPDETLDIAANISTTSRLTNLKNLFIN
ncbi:HDOD domain-containing protein [Desulfonatronovibrio magnus]|uniref:HDOD domain-containing protein n=1 Tax=Desulfonatronovibrio magnus TaxID=698827 RepID=UPI0005EB7071|nr:HDOD domain-containing protein [Desulfonatronovibrio magnus]RQD62536.1 MAG: HDOD domain-containing protein [Desulfonatronovibrio sp. MSAO_Bac4]